MDPILKQTLDWYVRLASEPGFKEHAWWQAKQLAKDYPAFFWKLPELLVAEMQRRRRDPS